MATASQIALAAGSITLHYHVSVLVPCDDEINTFWFEDAADLLCGVRRKLGKIHTGGLVNEINALGVDVVHAGCDPFDDEALIVADDEETLRVLTQSVVDSMDKIRRIESGEMPRHEIDRMAEGFNVSGVSHDMMHGSTIALANAAWKISDGIPA
jgi:hypothetical protein